MKEDISSTDDINRDRERERQADRQTDRQLGVDSSAETFDVISQQNWTVT